VELKLKSFSSSNNDADSGNDFSDDNSSDDEHKKDGNSDDEDDADSVVGGDVNTALISMGECYAYEYLEDTTICKTDTVAQFRQAWGKRCKKLVHDYSIAGWTLLPIPDVMEDASNNHHGRPSH
jgi:hypothetical protein